MNKEYESKNLITKAEYETLIQTYQPANVVVQKNYYFETADNFFRRHNSALRVRQIADEYVLTLKVKQKTHNEEYDIPLSEEQFFAILTTKCLPPTYQLPLTTTKPLQVITFTTTRSQIAFANQIVEIDKTDFGTTIDYEIEIEAENEQIAAQTLAKFLNVHQIDSRQSLPKIARYFNYLH